MLRIHFRAGLLAGAVGLILFVSQGAGAHGFAGARFFPATITTDDPFVADELALPTIAFSKDDGDVRTTTYSAGFAKRITPDFALDFGATYVRLRPPGGPSVDGFDNFSLGAKYQVAVDPMHESIFGRIDADIGGTGATIGAEDFSIITPTFFGRLGDLADRRFFALSRNGLIGVGIPRAHVPMAQIRQHPNGFSELALEHSFHLQSQVCNVGRCTF